MNDFEHPLANAISTRAQLVSKESGFFYFNKQVQPCIQVGPQCGILALRMAASCLADAPSVSSEQVFEVARRLELSNFGEILSANWMANLASNVLSCSASVENLSNLGKRVVFERILAGQQLLVPYDCDKNFEPCLNGGRSAHWCLLIGTVVIDSKLPKAGLRWAKDKKVAEAMMSKFSTDQMDLLLITMQSKSRQPGVWLWNRLCESNGNLFHLGRDGPGEGKYFKSPPDGLDELCGKVVILSPF